MISQLSKEMVLMLNLKFFGLQPRLCTCTFRGTYIKLRREACLVFLTSFFRFLSEGKQCNGRIPFSVPDLDYVLLA